MNKLSPEDFVKKYYPYAAECEKNTGLPLEISLTQGALETGWSGSTPGNMFFGEKMPYGWTGKRQLLTTTEVLNDDRQGSKFPKVHSIAKRSDGRYLYIVDDWFKAFDSITESFESHARLITGNNRYMPVLAAKPNINKMFDELQRCGYATATNYAETLKSIYKMIKPYIEAAEVTIKP
jgi:flagellum-specific peptidoglycan hydrolase FlgJ